MRQWLGTAASKLLLAFAAIAIVSAILLLGQCRRAQTATTQAKLATNQAAAAQSSGHDAVQTVGDTQTNETAIDAVGRENANAIDHASGASTAVDPAVRAAGLHALCGRASYRAGHPACMQQPAAR